MPCNHKFIEDLNLQNLDFQPTTLIVGTFNPAWPANNQAQWFYGRTQNNYFWDVLPRLYDEQSLLNASPVNWKAFCKRQKIAITDLVSIIEDAYSPEHDKEMAGYSDNIISKNFQKHTFVEIISLLEKYPSIKQVYLTRGATPTFWKKLWQPVKKFCKLNNIYETVLLTPSRYAFYQQGRYNNVNQQHPILNLGDFILSKWQEKWYQTGN